MKFQPDHLDGVNVVSRLEASRIWIRQTLFTSSLLVPWHGEIQAWLAEDAAQLTPAHFEMLLPMQPELVIFGSGLRQHFLSPALYRCLIDRRVGVETMDTAAACRTFNVLVNEGRKVVAALLLSPTDTKVPPD